MDKHFELVTRTVVGYMTSRHAKLMYGLIRWLQPQNVVEVGCFKGYVSLYLAKALEDEGRGHLWVIDNFSIGSDPSDVHNAMQLAGLANRVTILNGTSRTAQWPNTVDFAFIDGDHEFEEVVYDCDQAILRGAKCIVLHDTMELPGPKAYCELLREQGKGIWDCISVGFDMGLTVFLKRPDETPMFTMHPDQGKAWYEAQEKARAAEEARSVATVTETPATEPMKFVHPVDDGA